MIQVRYTNNEITAVGHSGYAEIGHDIVCASVSTAFKSVMASFFEYGFKFKFHAVEKQAFMGIQWEETKSKAVNAIFRGFIETLKSIAEEYPNYVKVDKVIIEDSIVGQA